MGVYDLISAAIDQALKNAVCVPFEACGMAELMERDNKTQPVTMDRSRKKIEPTEVQRLRLYHRYATNERRGEVEENSFGLNVNQEFSREMYLVGFGLSKLIHKECALNDADLAQQIADSFPTEVYPTTTVNNVQIRIIEIETDKATIAESELSGFDLSSRYSRLSFFRIRYKILGRYCKNSCSGDTVNICPDAIVIDTDSSVNNVPGGSTFTCTNPNVQNPNSVIWANFENTAENPNWAKFNDHVLQKDCSAAFGYNAGASSSVEVTAVKGTLEMDSFEFVVIGLNPGPPAFIPSPSGSNVAHGWEFLSSSNGVIRTREGGTVGATVGLDRFENLVRECTTIEWEIRFASGKIQFWYDGVLRKTSATSYPTNQTFHVYAVLYQPNAKLTTVEWVL